MNILVLNGPNLNFLGKREPEIYGNKTYTQLENYCKDFEKEFNLSIDVKQSNLEGILIDILQYADSKYDGVLLNAGAFTHYSYALYDCIKSLHIPVVEIHLSDIMNREDFRKTSVIKDACIDSVFGFGFESYKIGLQSLLERTQGKW